MLSDQSLFPICFSLDARNYATPLKFVSLAKYYNNEQFMKHDISTIGLMLYKYVHVIFKGKKKREQAVKKNWEMKW